MISDPLVLHRCRFLTRGAAGFVALSGLVVLCGWCFGIETFKALFSHQLTMKVNTSVCLIAAAISLWLLTDGKASGRTIGRALAAAVLLVGAATLSEHMVGWDLGIDQILHSELPGARATVSPGRMGPPASIALTFCGLALLLLDVR